MTPSRYVLELEVDLDLDDEDLARYEAQKMRDHYALIKIAQDKLRAGVVMRAELALR